ncbi:hypothetical protein GUJ93_ZPchr0121g49 [Zizania palustris]|uniref:Uncharacterized protein n=1 Tax=Zizania palustris TaxID=103762 RepID=A0A8J5RDC7_ZIZPA|nr:hypothetical protein GUJ93_ZPchr0121g49 [Zizania palustris]
MLSPGELYACGVSAIVCGGTEFGAVHFTLHASLRSDSEPAVSTFLNIIPASVLAGLLSLDDKLEPSESYIFVGHKSIIELRTLHPVTYHEVHDGWDPTSRRQLLHSVLRI